MMTRCFRTALIGALFTLGCAGPTSPFGGLELGSGDGEPLSITASEGSRELSISPKRQVLHRASPLQVVVTPPTQDLSEASLQVTYNKKNVTNAFQRFATREKGVGKQVKFVYDNLRLKPDRKHEIDFFLKTKSLFTTHFQYLPPDCPIEGKRSIASISPFEPPKTYLDSINTHAKSEGMSPSLLAGLIAQESGFDPGAVSRAKAVGLTQVTPLADEELKKVRPRWVRDNRIDKLSPADIEALIKNRKLGAKQDWRLNPNSSIEGGALYLSYLRSYWDLPENKEVLKSNPDVPYPEVILASYNSGAARVKSKILKRGSDWLSDQDLKEAYKYVNNVTSYCYHFSKEAQ